MSYSEVLDEISRLRSVRGASLPWTDVQRLDKEIVRRADAERFTTAQQQMIDTCFSEILAGCELVCEVNVCDVSATPGRNGEWMYEITGYDEGMHFTAPSTKTALQLTKGERITFKGRIQSIKRTTYVDRKTGIDHFVSVRMTIDGDWSYAPTPAAVQP